MTSPTGQGTRAPRRRRDLPDLADAAAAARHAGGLRVPAEPAALERPGRLLQDRAVPAHARGRAAAAPGLSRHGPRPARRRGGARVRRPRLPADRGQGLAVQPDEVRLPRLARRLLVRPDRRRVGHPARSQARRLPDGREKRRLQVHQGQPRPSRRRADVRGRRSPIRRRSRSSKSSARRARPSCSTRRASTARACRSWRSGRPSSTATTTRPCRLQPEDVEYYRYHPLLLNAAFLGDLSKEHERILGFGDKRNYQEHFVRRTEHPAITPSFAAFST